MTDYQPTVGDQITLQLPGDDSEGRTYEPWTTIVLVPEECRDDDGETHLSTVCVDCVRDWVAPLGDYELTDYPRR